MTHAGHGFPSPRVPGVMRPVKQSSVVRVVCVTSVTAVSASPDMYPLPQSTVQPNIETQHNTLPVVNCGVHAKYMIKWICLQLMELWSQNLFVQISTPVLGRSYQVSVSTESYIWLWVRGPEVSPWPVQRSERVGRGVMARPLPSQHTHSLVFYLELNSWELYSSLPVSMAAVCCGSVMYSALLWWWCFVFVSVSGHNITVVSFKFSQ